MEKKGKMTKLEQEAMREISRKEAGLRKLIEHTSLVAESLECRKGELFKEIRKRLDIKTEPIHLNFATGEIKWNE